MAEHIPDIEVYIRRLNWYLQEHYPANKKISAEEWNALFIALMNQGNAQEETLAKICNAILPQHVTAINSLLDTTVALDLRITNVNNDLSTRITNVNNTLHNRITDVNNTLNNRITGVDNALKDRINTLDSAVVHPETLHEGDYVSLQKESNNVTISVRAGDIMQGAVDVGHTTTGAPGSTAQVEKRVEGNKAIFDFTVPTGPQGEPGFGWIALNVKDGNLIVHTKEMDPKDFVIGPDGYMRINVKEEI